MAVDIIVSSGDPTVAILLNDDAAKLHSNICVYTHIFILSSTLVREVLLTFGNMTASELFMTQFMATCPWAYGYP